MSSIATNPNRPDVIDLINNAGSSVKDDLDQIAENLRDGQTTSKPNAETIGLCDPSDASVELYNIPVGVAIGSQGGSPGQQISQAEGFVWYSEEYTNLSGSAADQNFFGLTVPSGYRFRLMGYNLDTNISTGLLFMTLLMVPSGSVPSITYGSTNGFGVPCIPIIDTTAGLVGGTSVPFITVPGGFSLVAHVLALPNTKYAILTLYGVIIKDDNTRKERADTW